MQVNVLEYFPECVVVNVDECRTNLYHTSGKIIGNPWNNLKFSYRSSEETKESIIFLPEIWANKSYNSQPWCFNKKFWGGSLTIPALEVTNPGRLVAMGIPNAPWKWTTKPWKIYDWTHKKKQGPNLRWWWVLTDLPGIFWWLPSQKLTWNFKKKIEVWCKLIFPFWDGWLL